VNPTATICKPSGLFIGRYSLPARAAPLIVGAVHLLKSESLIKVLKIIVGIVLIGFGVKNIKEFNYLVRK
jgi:putative Mn2+ efflux pump MntP